MYQNIKFIKKKTSYIIAILLIGISTAKTQEIATKLNVVKLKAGQVLYADDRIILARNDTVIKLPITVDFYIKNGNSSNLDSIYLGLQEKIYKNRWLRELHNIIILPSENEKYSDTIQTQKSEVPFLKYRNLIIRKIILQKLDVFGPTVYSPNRPARTLVGKACNKIHIKTRDGVIYNHLLFKEGQSIDPITLADNERILRDLPFIEDARIRIENISAKGDSADVIIITKDTWSIGFDFTTPDFKNLYLDVWDNNIIGSGQEINNQVYRNPGKKPYSGLDGYYILRNINGTFINCRIGYSAFGSEGFNVDITRDFLTQRTKYAGELFFEKMNTDSLIQNQLNQYVYVPVDGTRTNFWIGRAFQIPQLSLSSTSISNFIISAGIYNNNFTTRPEVTEDTRYSFQNKTYYLFSYAFSNQGYYRSNLIYDFGRTEDIPYGFLIKFTHGIERNEFFNRFYNGFSISEGNYLGNLGYLQLGFALGGFLKQDDFEQGVLNLNSNFFTNLLVLDAFKLRHFVNVSFTKGYNRFKDELLDINGLGGIQGYENDSAKGTQKLSINFESVCFTPLYIAGFRFAIFGFADFAFIGRTTNNIFKNTLYSGFGLGVRIRNEKLVFKTFQIQLAFYPWLPSSASGQFFTITDESKFSISNFNIKSPEIIKFQ